MNSEFFSVSSTGLGDSRRKIVEMISGATAATYGDAAEETAAWAAARVIQQNLLGDLQAGGFIAAGPWYDLAALQRAFALSLEA